MVRFHRAIVIVTVKVTSLSLDLFPLSDSNTLALLTNGCRIRSKFTESDVVIAITFTQWKEPEVMYIYTYRKRIVPIGATSLTLSRSLSGNGALTCSNVYHGYIHTHHYSQSLMLANLWAKMVQTKNQL